MRNCAEQVPSLRRVGPRYLKLVVSSNVSPFMLIYVLMLFVLLVMILLFPVLTSIPYAVALSTSLLVRSLSSPLLPHITKTRQHKSAVIEDSTGNIRTESTAVPNRWTEYHSGLYNYELHLETHLFQPPHKRPEAYLS